MLRIHFMSALLVFAFSLMATDLASAGEFRFFGFFEDHPKSRTYRTTKPQVRGFRKRVGGYSYNSEDTLGATFGFGNTRQAAPFDSGFFFDSNFGSPLGEAPYLN